jgi:ubiquinone/menaquinone biosynthesis C-methylase UbiE/uncharacterized protein YbaR (Trm112 family)
LVREFSPDKLKRKLLPDELLEILACPICKGDLTVNGDELDGFGYLYCPSCRQKYRVSAGVLSILPPQLQAMLNERERDASLSIKEANIAYGSMFHREHVSSGYVKTISEDCLLPRGMGFILEHLKGKDSRILETCCSAGTTVSYLHNAGYRPFCFDISAESIEALLERHPGICHPFIADAENLPIKDNSFNAVIFNGALHHLPSPRLALEESMRILEKGGQVIIVEPNAVRSETMRVLFKSLVHPRSALKDLKQSYDMVAAKVNGNEIIERDGQKYQKDIDGRWIKYDTMDQEITLPYLLRIAKSVGFKVVEANTWDIALVPFQQIKPTPSVATRKRLQQVDAILEKIPVARTYGETMHVILQKP